MMAPFVAALCLIAALRVHPVGGHLDEINPLSYLKHSKVKVELGIKYSMHRTIDNRTTCFIHTMQITTSNSMLTPPC